MLSSVVGIKFAVGTLFRLINRSRVEREEVFIHNKNFSSHSEHIQGGPSRDDISFLAT